MFFVGIISSNQITIVNYNFLEYNSFELPTIWTIKTTKLQFKQLRDVFLCAGPRRRNSFINN